MSAHILSLVPSDALDAFHDVAALTAALRDMGFAGDPAGGLPDDGYEPGRRFHEFIVFQTSHRVIQLEPVGGRLRPVGEHDSRDRCRIFLKPAPSATPEFLACALEGEPACPSCGAIEANWTDVLDLWYQNKAGHRWSCAQCGYAGRVYCWDWRSAAAFVRQTIDIRQIRHGEATPAPTLLSALAEITGFPWTFFYVSI